MIEKVDRGPAKWQECARLFEQALKIDPQFTYAATYLSASHAVAYSRGVDPAVQQWHRTEARRWAEFGARQFPGGAADGAVALYHLFVENDTSKALPFAESYHRALPNDAQSYQVLALALERAGRPRDAVAILRQSLELDPGYYFSWRNLALGLATLREAGAVDITIGQCRIQLGENVPPNAFALALFQTKAELPANLDDRSPIERALFLARGREFQKQLVVLNEALAAMPANRLERLDLLRQRCDALRRLGREREAADDSKTLLSLVADLTAATQVDAAMLEFGRAMSESRAGRTDEAVRAMRRYVETVDPTKEPLLRWNREVELATLDAYLGKKRECVELLAKLLRVPSGITVPMLRVDPVWDNVREDAGFKALLADPKNSAPL